MCDGLCKLLWNSWSPVATRSGGLLFGWLPFGIRQTSLMWPCELLKNLLFRDRGSLAVHIEPAELVSCPGSAC